MHTRRSGHDQYWGEALNYVVYTENRSPTKALGGKTPFEVLYGRKPNIEHLRPFGCTAFAFVNRPKRTKLELWANKFVLLGYASERKSYRLVDCTSGQVFECRSVKFLEDQLGTLDLIPHVTRTTVAQAENSSEDELEVEQVSSQTPSVQVGGYAPVGGSTESPDSQQDLEENTSQSESSDQDSSDFEVDSPLPMGLVDLCDAWRVLHFSKSKEARYRGTLNSQSTLHSPTLSRSWLNWMEIISAEMC